MLPLQTVKDFNVKKNTVLVPDIGGAEGAEVIELLVAVGDEVTADQGLIVLESDKASMEVPADQAGTIAEIHVAVGDELSEGAAVVTLAAVGDAGDSTVQEQPVAQESEAESAVTSSPQLAVADDLPATAATLEQSVLVPDIGTDDAVEVIEVSVVEGDSLQDGDTIVVLESDKASMEVPAPYSGHVLKVLVNEGDSVKQGDQLLLVATVDLTTPVTKANSDTSVATASQASAPAAPLERNDPVTPPPAVTEPGVGIYAGPAVRKLAREFGVDLGQVGGSGPRGRVVKEDLQQFVQRALTKPAAASFEGGGIPVIPEVDYSAFGEIDTAPLTKIDKVTAANMHRSWLNVPRVTQFDDADITELEAFRAGLKAEGEARGVKLTPLPFLIKASAVALRNHPKMRSSLVPQREQLVYKQYCHIGMAVDTPAGLVVPVIKDADKKSLWELAGEVMELAAKARDRKLKPSDMQGASFTISSLGNIGGTGFTPIVNAPEVAILGVSRASIQPVWDGEAFQPRKMLPLALSYDHRVVNGGDGGRFMTELVGLLSDIRRLVL